MRYILFTVTFAVFLSEAQGLFGFFNFNWPHRGRCPPMNVQTGFSVDGYKGSWYVQYAYNIDESEGKGRCSSSNFTYNHADGVIYIASKHISSSSNKWVFYNETAQLVDGDLDVGKREVMYNRKFWFKGTRPYWILGTDYDSYSVAYSCENFFFFFHYYSAWQLSRTQFLEGDEANIYYLQVNEVMKEHNIDPSLFQIDAQANCDAPT